MMRRASLFARRLPAALLAALCCALWGSTSPILKAGFGWMSLSSGDYAGQLLFAGMRFVLAGLMVLALSVPLRRRMPWPNKADWKPIAVISLFQTVLQYVFYYIGLATAGSITASIVGGVNTFTSILLSALIFRQEKLTAPKIAGCALGLAGVALGLILSFAMCRAMGAQFVLSVGAIALGVGFSAAVGVLFGWAPARKASRLNPIDALRSV